MKTIIIPLLALILCGCAAGSLPQTYEFNPTATITTDYDAAWGALIEYFAIASLPIETIEKDSGLVVTSWMDAANTSYCDCGSPGMATAPWTRGKFNVFVQDTPEGIKVRVTCTYQQQIQFLDYVTVNNCNSTGELEAQLHNYIQARTSKQPLPDVPTFAPAPVN